MLRGKLFLNFIDRHYLATFARTLIALLLLKQLASQTAIYGLSTILARLLNFALTPLHTSLIAKAEYGILNDVYSMIALLMVLLTFGMETAFFRFQREGDYSSRTVFSAATGFTLFTSLLFIGATWLFQEPLAQWLQYEDRPHFLLWMMLIVAMDAIAAVPLAQLRARHQPYRFLLVRLGTIGLIVSLNLAFFLLFPWMLAQGVATHWVELVYEPGLGVAYVFIANLIGNVFMLLLLSPDLIRIRLKPCWPLLRRLLWYAAPLVLGFIAGVINEKAQFQFMKYLLPGEEGRVAMATFGAVMKIATFMVLFIQAFRFAAEPFFFSGEGAFKPRMARVMRYFVTVQALIFLGLTCFLEIIKRSHFIAEKYWDGFQAAPILLFANLLLGINFNLNMWYKLEKKTQMGIYITSVGLVFTVIANLMLVPRFGYMGAAWSTLISYASMTIYAYYLNQKHHRVAYPVKLLLSHLLLAVGGAYLSYAVFESGLLAGTLIFASYSAYLAYVERSSLSELWQRIKL
jgi:O-antigen/teichoic acid export membrane protein